MRLAFAQHMRVAVRSVGADELVRRCAAAVRQRECQKRYAILFRITDARLPATRERRVDQLVAMLDCGETVYPKLEPSEGRLSAAARRWRAAGWRHTGWYAMER